MVMEFNGRCPQCGFQVVAFLYGPPEPPEAVDAPTPPLPEGADYHRESALQLLAELEKLAPALSPLLVADRADMAHRALIHAILSVSYELLHQGDAPVLIHPARGSYVPGQI